jgi:hypothetical protein
MDFSLCLFLYRREIRDGEFCVMCWLYIKMTRWSFWLLITDLFFSFLKNKTAVVCCYLHVLRFTGLEAWNILVNRNKFLWTFDMILEFCYSVVIGFSSWWLFASSWLCSGYLLIFCHSSAASKSAPIGFRLYTTFPWISSFLTLLKKFYFDLCLDIIRSMDTTLWLAFSILRLLSSN